MRIFYILFISFIILSINCSSKKNIVIPRIEEKPNPNKTIPEQPSKNCDDRSCQIIPKPNIKNNDLDERYYLGDGWDIILPENWVLTPNKDYQLNATFEKGNIFIIGSIMVIDYDKNCLWSFSKEKVEDLMNKPNIKVLDSIIVDINGTKHVVLLFVSDDKVIGLQALTTFNKKGYITMCLGSFESEEDIKFILDRCSDFSNSINFSTVRRFTK